MNPYLTSGITGAAPIWNRVMSYLLKNYGTGNKWYEKPDNVVEKIVIMEERILCSRNRE